MAIVHKHVQLEVAEGTLGEKMDGVEITAGVTRQALAVGDPEDRTKIAKVTTGAPAGGDAGLVVRPVGSFTISPAVGATPGHLAPLAANVSDHQILAANANRVKAIITNDPQATAGAVLTLRFAGTAGGDEPIVLHPWDTWVEEHYKGEIRGIWSAANGRTRRQELAT